MIKNKTKIKQKIYTTKKKRLNRESNLAHLRGRSPPRPLRHAAKDISNWENYYIQKYYFHEILTVDTV